MSDKMSRVGVVVCALAMMFFVSACEDGDGGGTETVVVTNIVDGEVVVETVVTESDDAAGAAEEEDTEGLTEQPEDEGVVDDEEEPVRVPFGKRSPTGLAATKVGGGGLAPLRYELSCNLLPGAVRYAFTTSLGTSDTAGELSPRVTISIGPGDFEKKVIFHVYAMDRFGVPSRTASHTFSPR